MNIFQANTEQLDELAGLFDQYRVFYQQDSDVETCRSYLADRLETLELCEGLLVHSRLTEPDEVLTFMKQWDGSCPIVVVPTKYYKTPSSVFAEAGISLAIWANHLARACITAMQATAADDPDSSS